MSGQPAEQSEGFTSSDSRLDAILNQLNALGSPAPAPEKAAPALRSVPDLPSVVVSEAHVDDVALASRETVAPPETVSPPEAPMPREPLAAVPTAPPAVLPPPVPETSTSDIEAAVPQAPPVPQVDPITEPTNFTFGVPDSATSPVTPPPEMAPPMQLEPEALVPPEILAQPDIFDIAPVSEDQSAVAEELPVVVEYHSDSQELVFELDGPLEAEPLSVEPAGVAFDQSAVAAPDVDPTTPPPLPPGGDTGWISHHSEPAAEPAEAPLESTEAPDVANDAMSALVEAQASVLEVPMAAEPSEGDTSFESPQWGEINENDDVVEEAPFSAFNPHAVTEMADQYETDEDLPLPDFTGVWDDSTVPSVWDAEANERAHVPDPVEIPGKGSGISVGRNELDSLRPVEEEKAEREPAQNLGRKMQLFAVILFGLIALAVVLLNDPAAVDELREIYDGFFG